MHFSRYLPTDVQEWFFVCLLRRQA
jgi:hypothetical protein